MPDSSPNIIMGLLATLYAGALIYIFGSQSKNIAAIKVEDEKKVPTTMCDERTENVRREIQDLKTDTSKQWEVISAVRDTSIEIKTMLESMIENKHKRKGDE